MPESCGRHREEARSSWARRPRHVARSQGGWLVPTYLCLPNRSHGDRVCYRSAASRLEDDGNKSERSEAKRSPSGCSSRVNESGSDPNRSSRKSASAHRSPRTTSTTGTSTADTHTKRDIVHPPPVVTVATDAAQSTRWQREKGNFT